MVTSVSYYVAYVLAFCFCIVMHRLYLRKTVRPSSLNRRTCVVRLCSGSTAGARVGYVILYALPEFCAPWFMLRSERRHVFSRRLHWRRYCLLVYPQENRRIHAPVQRHLITTIAPMGMLLAASQTSSMVALGHGQMYGGQWYFPAQHRSGGIAASAPSITIIRGVS